MGGFSLGRGRTVIPATRQDASTNTVTTPTKEVTPTVRKEVRSYTFLPEDSSNPTWKVNKEYVDEPVETTASSGKENLTAENTDKETAQGETESKSNDIEYNTLRGTLNYIATPETIKIKAGDTIELKNLGKYLSGLYYVQDVTRNVSSNGYSHSATLIKTDYGTSLKTDPTSTKPDTNTSTSGEIPKDDSGAIVETYTVCKGDTPYTIAKKKYGEGRRCDRLFDYKTKTRIDITTQLTVGQVLIVS